MVCWLAIPESGGHLRLYFVACRAGSCPAPLTARGVPCGGGAAGSCPAPLTARGVPCGGGAAGSCPAPLTARGVPCGGGAAGSCPAPLTARGVPCGGGAAGSCPLALAVCRPCGCVCGLSKKKGRGRCAPALCGLRVQLFGVKPRASAFFWTCSTVFAIALCVTPR